MQKICESTGKGIRRSYGSDSSSSVSSFGGGSSGDGDASGSW